MLINNEEINDDYEDSTYQVFNIIDTEKIKNQKTEGESEENDAIVEIRINGPEDRNIEIEKIIDNLNELNYHDYTIQANTERKAQYNNEDEKQYKKTQEKKFRSVSRTNATTFFGGII